LQNANGDLKIYQTDDGYSTIKSSAGTSTWYHVFVRMASSYARTCHVDGSQVYSATTGTNGDSTNFYVGSGYNSTFNGYLDEVRISSVARSATYGTTSYNFLSDPASCITVGNEELESKGAPVYL